MRGSAEVEAHADALARELDARGLGGARLAVVLGSGLGAFAESLDERREVDGAELASLPRGRVPGHAGRLVRGVLEGVPVLVQVGRAHLYEGFPAHEVTRAVRAFARLGVQRLLLTNAAGSLVAEWGPGTLMRVVDHVSLQGAAPLLRREAGAALPYDPGFGDALERGARRAGTTLERGVYAGVLGPAYETPSEIRMLRRLGVHAVGMSTVAEASVARALGMRVACLSCLTNHAAGITSEPLRHDDVVRAGAAAAGRLVEVLRSTAAELGREGAETL